MPAMPVQGIGGERTILAMFKDAGLVALVSLALAVPMVLLHTIDRGAGGGLTIELRIAECAIAVTAVFFGRLGLSLAHTRAVRLVLAVSAFIAGYLFLGVMGYAPLVPEHPLSWLCAMAAGVVAVRAVVALRRQTTDRTGGIGAAGGWLRRHALPISIVAIGLATVLPLMPFADRRFLDLAILVMTYIMLGWGLNIVVGLAGLLDLGYVAFYAVGAYSYALLAINFDLSFWVCLPLAGLFAGIFGILLGFPVLRLRGDYLAIVTLGFGEMIRVILLNWNTFTGGPDGLSGIARPSFFGLPFARRAPEGETAFHGFFGLEYAPIHRIVLLYYLILILALATNYFTLRIRRLPVGRAWEALREDEVACRSLGINPTNTKLTAFAIGAMFAGFAGSFFATRQGFISPESFTFIESAVILAIVVMGGMGSQVGVVLGAILMIGVPEFFRELAQYRMLAFGAGMVLIMIWRPSGLLAHREPTIRLRQSESGGGVRP